VVVEMVWKVCITPVTVVQVSESGVGWMMVVLFSLSDSCSADCVGAAKGEVGDGDCGASSKERREVFASDGMAYAGGSQDGVRA
jgi:hypothetical protein